MSSRGRAPGCDRVARETSDSLARTGLDETIASFAPCTELRSGGSDESRSLKASAQQRRDVVAIRSEVPDQIRRAADRHAFASLVLPARHRRAESQKESAVSRHCEWLRPKPREIASPGIRRQIQMRCRIQEDRRHRALRECRHDVIGPPVGGTGTARETSRAHPCLHAAATAAIGRTRRSCRAGQTPPAHTGRAGGRPIAVQSRADSCASTRAPKRSSSVTTSRAVALDAGSPHGGT